MNTQLFREINQELIALELKVRRRELESSYNVADQTLCLFDHAIDKATNLTEARDVVNFLCAQLVRHFPRYMLMNNICEMVKARIFEELDITDQICSEKKEKKINSELKTLNRNHSSSLSNISCVVQFDKNSIEMARNSNERNKHFYANEESRSIIRSYSRSFLDYLVSEAEPGQYTRELSADFQPQHPTIRTSVSSTSHVFSSFDEEMTLSSSDSINDFLSTEKLRMKETIVQLSETLQSSYNSIANYASEFLFPRDSILVCGYSKSTLKFLAEASKRDKPSHGNSKFNVFVVEHAPLYDGIKMANLLKEYDIGNVILIPDSGIFAIMPTITKIVIPANVVLATGGVISFSSTSAIAQAAKRYSTPVIVLYWSLKLADKITRPGKVFTNLLMPAQMTSIPSNCSQGTSSSNTNQDKNTKSAQPFSISTHLNKVFNTLPSNVITFNAEGDFIPMELVTILISEEGPHSPTDVFSIVQSSYS